MLSPEEKKRLLKALEEDEEFRMAVAGALGLGEIPRDLRELEKRLSRHIALGERRWRQWLRTWKKFLEENERR